MPPPPPLSPFLSLLWLFLFSSSFFLFSLANPAAILQCEKRTKGADEEEQGEARRRPLAAKTAKDVRATLIAVSSILRESGSSIAGGVFHL